MKPFKSTQVLATVVVAVFVLAGCSGAPTEGSPADGTPAEERQGLFEFETAQGGTDSGELQIRVPEALIEAAGSDAEKLLITEVKAKPRDLEGAGYCAVDLTVSYAGDAPEVLTEPSMTKAEWEAQAQNEFERQLMQEFGASTEDEALANASSDGSSAEYVAEHIEELKAISGLGTTYTPAPSWGLLSGAQPVSDLDDTDPEPGTYYSKDHNTLTLVERCAASPTDDDNAVEFDFPVLSEEGEIETFASVMLSFMKSGTMIVSESEVSDFVLDSEGNWIAS